MCAVDRAADSNTPLVLHRILLAASHGDSSAGACWYAAALAHSYGAELFVVHVVPTADFDKLDESGRAAETARLEAEFRRAAGAEFAGLPVVVLLEGGDIVAAMPALVARHAIELIVAGDEGRHGLQKLLAPPADAAIAVTGACPVLLVGRGVIVPAGSGLCILTILHPTDLDPQSKGSLELAYALAQRHRAALYLLHVADNVWKDSQSTRLSPEAFCRMRLIQAGLPERSASVELRFIVEFGSPESLILENAERLGVDLIVMGVPASAHPELAAHLPGPLAYNIASHAACPVLALAHAAEKEPMKMRP